MPNLKAFKFTAPYIQSAKIILVPQKGKINFGKLTNCTFFQYRDSNIGLLSIAPYIMLDLQTLQKQTLFASCFIGLMASFVYCFRIVIDFSQLS